MKSRRAPQARQRIALLLPQSLVATVEGLARHFDAERAATMRLLLYRGIDLALRELPDHELAQVLAIEREVLALQREVGGNAPTAPRPPTPATAPPRAVDDR